MISKLCISQKPIAPIFRHRAIKNYNMDENMNVGWCFNAKVNYSTFEIFLCVSVFPINSKFVNIL